MRRREFITLLGGAAAAWPFAVRTQQTTPAVSLVYDATPSEATPFLAAFQRGLVEVGLSRVRMWPSNIAMRETTTNSCGL